MFWIMFQFVLVMMAIPAIHLYAVLQNQLLLNLQHLVILATHPHVAQTLNVLMVNVDVLQNIKEIRMKDVDLNVAQMLIAVEIELV